LSYDFKKKKVMHWRDDNETRKENPPSRAARLNKMERYWIPAFAGTSFAGMTHNFKRTHLLFFEAILTNEFDKPDVADGLLGAADELFLT